MKNRISDRTWNPRKQRREKQEGEGGGGSSDFVKVATWVFVVLCVLFLVANIVASLDWKKPEPPPNPQTDWLIIQNSRPINRGPNKPDLYSVEYYEAEAREQQRRITEMQKQVPQSGEASSPVLTKPKGGSID